MTQCHKPIDINQTNRSGIQSQLEFSENEKSIDKGCYIGQELTNRTKYTGVIRRIALPYIVHPRHKAM